MSDEEFMQHVMEQMGINGGLEGMLGGMGGGFNMTDIIQQWEEPFDVFCDCVPTDVEHGTINGWIKYYLNFNILSYFFKLVGI